MGRIALERVVKRFGDATVIQELDLEIAHGEFVVFVGPSGCGKSTLLRLIAGLEDLTSGRVLIDDEDVTEVPPARRGLSMVFQSYALYPHMTVYNNIAFPLRMAGMDRAAIDERVRKAARTLGLESLLDRRPGQLSGGQRQRVAIGRAIVREPRAFLFDEPLSNLDAALRVQMRLEIAELHYSLATTMIYVTHDQVEAMTLADRIVVLNGGRIEQVGAPLELYNRPANLFVATFIGSPRMNIIEGPAAEALGAPTIGVRPEHIAVSREPGGPWSGVVTVVERLGADTWVHVNTEDAGSITARAEGDADIRHDERVWLVPDPARIHRFDREGRRIA
jgi:multiple sugar transport system ATP-binding protein